MGIMGMGDEFRSRFAYNNSTPLRTSHKYSDYELPSLTFGRQADTVNVTYKNGPDGFWGFMSSLFGALGGSDGVVDYCGDWLGKSSSKKKADTQQTNLATLYPGWNIVKEDDGTFTMTKKTDTGGFNQIKGTYAEIQTKMATFNTTVT